MGNPHFGNLANVFKHLTLGEIIAQHRPTEYWESHAGAAAHPETADPTAERGHGVHTFRQSASSLEVLRVSQFFRLLGEPKLPLTVIPGSPLLARKVMGDNARRFLLCDTDAGCLLNIQEHFRKPQSGLKELGQDTLECVQDDGVSVLRGAGMTQPQQWLASTLAFLDPEDIHETGAAGISPLLLACELANRGILVVASYGFKNEAGREWQQKNIRQTLEGARLLNRGVARFEGSLVAAHAPTQWGFGILTFNVSAAIQAIAHMKLQALQGAYEKVEMAGPAGKVSGAWRYHFATL